MRGRLSGQTPASPPGLQRVEQRGRGAARQVHDVGFALVVVATEPAADQAQRQPFAGRPGKLPARAQLGEGVAILAGRQGIAGRRVLPVAGDGQSGSQSARERATDAGTQARQVRVARRIENPDRGLGGRLERFSRLARVHGDDACADVFPVQGGLWSAQHLDLLDIEQRTGGEERTGAVGAVDEIPDGGFEGRDVADVADAPDAQRRGRRPDALLEAEHRHASREIRCGLDPARGEVGAAHRGHAERDLLQQVLSLPGEHDDLRERLGVGRGLGCAANRREREDREAGCRQVRAPSTVSARETGAHLVLFCFRRHPDRRIPDYAASVNR